MGATAQRAKRTELIKFVEGSDVPLRKCHVHGFLPQSEFYDSSIRRSVYACKECTRKSRGTYHFTERGRDVYCAAEIRKREKIDFSPEQFSWSVKRWDNTCFLTGKTGREPTARVEGSNAPADSSPPSFTLIRADPSEVFSKNNSVLCCRALARTLAWQLPPHLLASYKARVAEEANATEAVAAEETLPVEGSLEPNSVASSEEEATLTVDATEAPNTLAEPTGAETTDSVVNRPTATDSSVVGSGAVTETVTALSNAAAAELTAAPKGLCTKGFAPVKNAAVSEALERGRQMLAKRKRAFFEAGRVVAAGS